MAAIGYYIFYFFNWTLTLLPLPVLYVFSPLIYFVLYHFPSYRRKIVRTNLVNSFPEKSIEEIIRIEKKFYRHLSELFIEIFKLTHMSEKSLRKRFIINDTKDLERLYEQKRDIIAVLGHYSNWEWLTILSVLTSYKTVSIYKPLHNKYFNGYLNGLRTKFGMVLTPMSNIVREIINDRKSKVNTIYAFISDQTPPLGDIKYWTTFMNQDTPVYLGAEKIAEKYDMAVVFFNIQKVRKGYYNLHIEPLIEHPSGMPEHKVTEAHVKRLEEIIREHPEYWIWSHRRWKHKKPENA